MIADGPELVWPAGGRLRLSDLRRRLTGRKVPATLFIETPTGGLSIWTTTTPAGFRGDRPWLVCPGCSRRTTALTLVAGEARCRHCVGWPYRSSRHHRCPWWVAWGRAVHRLAGVRDELSRRYLRLARRGELEREEARLIDGVCRGLAAEIASGPFHLGQAGPA